MGKGEVIFQRSLTRVATTSKDNEFSVVSYNILCDDVFEKNPKLYSYLALDVKCRGPFPNDCPRHTQLVKELHWLDADVICLQEVDPFYFPCLLQELAPKGYDGRFQQHTTQGDGLATFFKTQKFELVDYRKVGFNEVLGKTIDLDKLANGNKHNQRFAQYTTLRDIKSQKEMVVVNVHLTFNFWREPDVHAAQASVFFRQLYELLPNKAKHSTPWVVCGDFNMQPHFPIYNLIKNGCLSERDARKLRSGKYKYPEITEKIATTKHDRALERDEDVHEMLLKELKHPFKSSSSAYKAVRGCEPKFTHYECDDVFPSVFHFDKMIDTLDYIWFSSDLLRANAVLEIVDEELIKPFCACPNMHFPSDHLSLKAVFQFIDNDNDSAYSSEES